MAKLNITSDQVEKIETAKDPDDDNACFFGCMAITAGLVRFLKYILFFNFLSIFQVPIIIA